MAKSLARSRFASARNLLAKSVWAIGTPSLIVIVATGIEQSMPVLIGYAVDSMKSRPDGDFLHTFNQNKMSLLIACMMTYMFVWELGVRLWSSRAPSLMEEAYTTVLEKVFKADHAWLTDNEVGGISKRIGKGVRAIEALGDLFLYNVVPITMTFVFFILYFSLKWIYAPIPLIMFIGFFLYLNASMSKRYVASSNKEANNIDSEVGSYTNDVLTAALVIKHFTAEKSETGRLRSLIHRWSLMQKVSWMRQLNMIHAQTVVISLLRMSICLVAQYAWYTGHATAGDLAFALTSAFLIGGYFRGLGNSIRNAQQASIQLFDFFDLFTLPVESTSDDSASEESAPVADNTTLTFENVSFTYPGADKPILENLTFSISAGEVIAIVSPSGGGKSTIIKLLCRFIEPTSGRIDLGGTNTVDMPITHLRRQVAVIPQENILLNRSIKENVILGAENSDDSDIALALETAGATSFVQTLHEGMDYNVGERGRRLSGGQIQRLCIARAVTRAAPILVLDEATSALDGKTEQAILNAIAKRRGRATTIIVTHRDYHLSLADRVLVIENGILVEDGSPAALLRKANSRLRDIMNTKKKSFSEEVFSWLGKRFSDLSGT